MEKVLSGRWAVIQESRLMGTPRRDGSISRPGSGTNDAVQVKAWEKSIGIGNEDLTADLQESYFNVGWGQELNYKQLRKE